ARTAMTDEPTTLLPPAAGVALDEPTVRAIDLVVDANGDLDVWFATRAAVLEGRPDAMLRFARRSGVAIGEARRVTDGVVAVPAELAVEMCRGLSRREPLTVLAHLVAEEHRIGHGGRMACSDGTAARARALVRAWADGREAP